MVTNIISLRGMTYIVNPWSKEEVEFMKISLGKELYSRW